MSDNAKIDQALTQLRAAGARCLILRTPEDLQDLYQVNLPDADAWLARHESTIVDCLSETLTDYIADHCPFPSLDDQEIDEDRVARIMAENADQPGFDRYSALAAIEAEDM